MKYTPSIPSLIGAWVKTQRKRNALHGPDHFQSEGELRAEGERAIEAHDTEVREPLLARIAELEGQVARVEAWYGWRRGTDVLEAIAIPTEGEYVGTGLKPGMKYYASVNGGEPQEYTSGQALAAPAERTGVSRESIEQVRWAEANPNAVALDDVEAKRRRTAKSSSQQKRVREMGESDWSNVAPFDTESEIQQSRRTAEGGEHVHLFESDGCITVGCTTQVCAACGHVENPHIEGCKAAEGGE